MDSEGSKRMGEECRGHKAKSTKLFKKNEINGLELLALNEFGLEKMGVSRPGTICLLIKAIKQLEKSTQDVSTLIEYSPYCFGKILDYILLKCFHSKELIDEPRLPTVSNDQKERYEKVVRYYFPGESAEFLLPQKQNACKRKRRDSSISSSSSTSSSSSSW